MKLPYRYRGAAGLALLLIVLPWMSWHYALSDSFRAWRDCVRLREAVGRVPQPDAVSVRAPLEDPALLPDGTLMTLLLPKASACGVRIRDYKPSVTAVGQGLEVHTASLTLAGPFAGILKVTYELETGVQACKPVSLCFGAAVSPDRRSRTLQATLYVEQIVEKEGL